MLRARRAVRALSGARPDIRVAAREVGATACPREVGATACPRAAAPQGCALQLRSAGPSVRTRGRAGAGAAGVCARGARSTARVSRVRKQGAQSKGTERNRCEKGKAERGTGWRSAKQGRSPVRKAGRGSEKRRSYLLHVLRKFALDRTARSERFGRKQRCTSPVMSSGCAAISNDH